MKLFEDGDPLFAPQLNALFAAFRGTAVMAGCEASATGTSRVVSIAAGQVQINGNAVNVGSGSVTLDTGSTFDRYDLISVDASGSKIVTKGATKRKCPVQPADTCLLAIVFVPAGATVIATGDVYDARMLASLVIAAAIECYGAIGCQTGNIGARTGFVDVPGDVVRKTFSPNVTLNYNDPPATLATFTVPANYSANHDSNFRIGVRKTTSYFMYSTSITVYRNGVQIGSLDMGYDQSTGNLDTTGGCKAGDVITVEGKYNGDERFSPVVQTVEVKSARRADIPAYKVFAETGAW